LNETDFSATNQKCQ